MSTAHFYSAFIKNQFDSPSSGVDFDADTIKCALTTSSYSPDIDSHDYFDDVSDELSTGSGYTAGGVTLSSCDVVYNSGSNEVRFTFDDPQWTSASFTARVAVIYKDTGTASTSNLIGYCVLDSDVTVTSGTLTLDFADPAFKITVS